MESLLSLPSEVFVHELCPFLTWTCLARLDASLCSSKLRPLLLHMYTYMVYPMHTLTHTHMMYQTTVPSSLSLSPSPTVTATATQYMYISDGMDEIQLKWFLQRNITLKCIDFVPAVSDKTLLLLAEEPDKCEGLIQLDMNFCHNISDLGAIALAQKCRDLTSLSLSCTYVRNGALKAFVVSCHFLSDVNLAYCTQITDESIQFLAQNCKNLRSLELRGCATLSQLSFRAIGQYCSRLVHLCLGGCHLTDDGLMALCQGCTMLNSLDLSYSLQSVSKDALMCLGMLSLQELNITTKNGSTIDDSVIHEIACNSKHHLRILTMGSSNTCDNITDSAAESIAEHCPAVTSLDFSHCAITDAGVVALAEGCQKLVSLDLSYTFIEDLSIQIISHGFPTLINVDVSECRISPQSLQAMQELPEWRLTLDGIDELNEHVVAYRVMSDIN